MTMIAEYNEEISLTFNDPARIFYDFSLAKARHTMLQEEKKCV